MMQICYLKILHKSEKSWILNLSLRIVLINIRIYLQLIYNKL